MTFRNFRNRLADFVRFRQVGSQPHLVAAAYQSLNCCLTYQNMQNSLGYCLKIKLDFSQRMSCLLLLVLGSAAETSLALALLRSKPEPVAGVILKLTPISSTGSDFVLRPEHLPAGSCSLVGRSRWASNFFLSCRLCDSHAEERQLFSFLSVFVAGSMGLISGILWSHSLLSAKQGFSSLHRLAVTLCVVVQVNARLYRNPRCII
jgi:hypothetical protein